MICVESLADSLMFLSEMTAFSSSSVSSRTRTIRRTDVYACNDTWTTECDTMHMTSRTEANQRIWRHDDQYMTYMTSCWEVHKAYNAILTCKKRICDRAYKQDHMQQWAQRTTKDRDNSDASVSTYGHISLRADPWKNASCSSLLHLFYKVMHICILLKVSLLWTNIM